MPGYNRCEQHGITRCLMCEPQPRVAPVAASSQALATGGFDPESALDLMPGPTIITGQSAPQATDDPQLAEAMERAAAIRRARETGESDIVIPGVTDVPTEEPVEPDAPENAFQERTQEIEQEIVIAKTEPLPQDDPVINAASEFTKAKKARERALKRVEAAEKERVAASEQLNATTLAESEAKRVLQAAVAAA